MPHTGADFLEARGPVLMVTERASRMQESQHVLLTDGSVQKRGVKNICQREMKMIHSEEMKTHRTLHIEFRVTAAVVQFLKYSRDQDSKE